MTPINLTVDDDDAVGLRVAEGGGSGGGAVWSVDGKVGDVTVLPTGGTQGQILKKHSGTDYDVEWATDESPSPSSATPQALGVASAGSSTDYSRADHVHAMPTASQVGAELPTTIVNKTSSDTSQTLAANTFYVWPEMSALTITCPATGGPYAFRFTSGSTATTLTMTGITMPNDFAVEANKVYEINVFEGYGIAVSWGVGSS